MARRKVKSGLTTRNRRTSCLAAALLALTAAGFVAAPAWAETTSVTLQYADDAQEEAAPNATEQPHSNASPFPKTGDASGVISALAFLGAAAAGAALLKASCYGAREASERESGRQEEGAWP